MLVVFTFSSELENSASNQDLHGVQNTLYVETSISTAQYSQINSSEIQTGHVYEVASSAVVRQGYPYETPVPLGAFDGGND